MISITLVSIVYRLAHWLSKKISLDQILLNCKFLSLNSINSSTTYCGKTRLHSGKILIRKSRNMSCYTILCFKTPLYIMISISPIRSLQRATPTPWLPLCASHTSLAHWSTLSKIEKKCTFTFSPKFTITISKCLYWFLDMKSIYSNEPGCSSMKIFNISPLFSNDQQMKWANTSKYLLAAAADSGSTGKERFK